MFHVSNVDVWKIRMSAYLKTLGMHVYLTTTKKSYLDNNKHIEANAQALEALWCTLSKEYLMLVSHCDSAIAVWNTLTSPKLQTTNHVEKESSEDESEQACYMVQGNDSLEVHSEIQLDDCASSSNNDHNSMDDDALNEELSIVCENLLEKYQVLKKKSFKIKEENKNLSSKLDIVLQERDEISIERDSLKSQLDLALNENKILKSKNDCNDVLKKNEVLSSKLNFVLKKNNSLKNKIALISKELNLISKKNISLKNDFDSHVCHATINSSSINKHVACSTSSSKIKNDVCDLKKCVDCLGSTLS